MELTFRFNGEPGAIIAPPGFDLNVLPDGLRMNVPVGYTVTVDPLNPLGINVQENQNVAHNQNLLNITEHIIQDSIDRVLSQSEVLFLLGNDTMPLTVDLEPRPPIGGLFMRPIQLFRHPDGHSYNIMQNGVPVSTHHNETIMIGDDNTPVMYRWSHVPNPPDDPANCLTARRYFFPTFGAKFLIQYLRGNQHVDDGHPSIPIDPVLPNF